LSPQLERIKSVAQAARESDVLNQQGRGSELDQRRTRWETGTRAAIPGQDHPDDHLGCAQWNDFREVQVLTDLFEQVSESATDVTGGGKYDARDCHDAIHTRAPAKMMPRHGKKVW
jgi:hypothetical protein